MKTESISVNEVEYAAHRLAVEFMTWNEPIPPFGSRFPNILESCLKVPFQTYNGINLYRRLTGKAAILFYLMVKNHPFKNGNKRIAVMTLLFFLYKNGKWLDMGNNKLYDIAVGVAESKPKSKDSIIRWLEEAVSQCLTNYSASLKTVGSWN